MKFDAHQLAALDERQRYSIDEAAAYLRCSRAQLYKKIKVGVVLVIKDGDRTYVPGSVIARLSRAPDQNVAPRAQPA